MKIVFNSVIPINTFCQTYENEIISRGTNGVMSVSNLIPPQLKKFVQSFGVHSDAQGHLCGKIGSNFSGRNSVFGDFSSKISEKRQKNTK